MDGGRKCKLPSTPRNTGLNNILTWLLKILNFKTYADVNIDITARL